MIYSHIKILMNSVRYDKSSKLFVLLSTSIFK